MYSQTEALSGPDLNMTYVNYNSLWRNQTNINRVEDALDDEVSTVSQVFSIVIEFIVIIWIFKQ